MPASASESKHVRQALPPPVVHAPYDGFVARTHRFLLFPLRLAFDVKAHGARVGAVVRSGVVAVGPGKSGIDFQKYLHRGFRT